MPRSFSPVADIPESVALYHSHAVGADQCCSSVVQEIRAPARAVWSVLRRFDAPQAYKSFVRSCDILGSADPAVGSLRRVVSGLPAATSTERLELLDDTRHVIGFSVVGGDHRLANYRSVTTLHPSPSDETRTVAVESYVVDIPDGNTKDETFLFVDTILKCNLRSLARAIETNRTQQHQ